MLSYCSKKLRKKNVDFLMSTSLVLCDNLIFINQNPCRKSLSLHTSSKFLLQLSSKRRRFCGFVPNAKKNSKSHSKRRRSWWQRFFFDDDGNWLGLKDDDMLEAETEAELLESSSDEELSEGEKFEAWKRRAEAIVELREAQEEMLNEESRRWEDWIVDDNDHVNGSWWGQEVDGNRGTGGSMEDVRSDPTDLIAEKGFVESVRDLVLGREEEDMLYEDRIFQYASLNSVS